MPPSTRPEFESLKRKIDRRDPHAAVYAHELFDNNKAHENVLVWICGCIFERRVIEAYDLLLRFLDVFPDSLHPVRVMVADVWGLAGNVDSTTEEARTYLRCVKNAGLLNQKMTAHKYVGLGASKAFRIMPSVYIDAGARSYAVRVLKYALQLPLVDEYRHMIEQEIEIVSRERDRAPNRARDDQWEAFFASGNYARELHDYCLHQGYKKLALRVGILEGYFHFNKIDAVTQEEMLLLPVQGVMRGVDEVVFTLE
ncbi:MAG: hypothetical protein GF398_08855 [Chitinivibrionales bacterium]|nr:hypothetical protein [Chitinivibrionales bacterium]